MKVSPAHLEDRHPLSGGSLPILTLQYNRGGKEMMNKIRYINMCITEFGKKFGMEPHIAFNYLKEYKGIDFLNRYYEAEHQLSLNDAINDLISICKRNGGTVE